MTNEELKAIETAIHDCEATDNDDARALCAAVRERDATIAKLAFALRRLGERAEGEDFVASTIVEAALAKVPS